MTDDDDRHGWNHLQCVQCWLRKWGLTRTPVRVKDRFGHCCFCGAETGSGIFVRARPYSNEIPHCIDATGTIFDQRWSPPRSE